jgi:hypothetical protein
MPGADTSVCNKILRKLFLWQYKSLKRYLKRAGGLVNFRADLILIWMWLDENQKESRLRLTFGRRMCN